MAETPTFDDDNSNFEETQEYLENLEQNLPKKKFIFASKKEMITALNKTTALVPVGSEMRFLFINNDGYVFRSERAAKLALSQYHYKTTEGDLKQAFNIWMKSPDRREYEGVEFNPDVRATRHGYYNLFQGWAIPAADGDCSIFQDHLLHNICQGNEEYFVFLIAVMAQMLQYPAVKIGIAVVLRGLMGTGKSIVSKWLAKIIGHRHAPVIDKPDQLTGRFTGQLEYAILVCVEEGYYPGDPTSKAAMKHLITGERLMIERKGIDAYERPNYSRVFITTNSAWAIAAAAGERRYFFLDVGDARKQDGAYFAALDQQMENGGAAAFHKYLLSVDLAGFDFSKPPVTAGLLSQIRLGFTAEEKWLESCLVEGRLPRKDSYVESEDWPDSVFEIAKDTVIASYRDFVPGFRSSPTPQQVGNFMAAQFSSIEETRPMVGGKRVRHWRLPTLTDARREFVAKHAGYAFPESATKPEATPVRFAVTRGGKA